MRSERSSRKAFVLLDIFGLMLVVLMVMTCGSMCMACGLYWQRPSSHFDGVDEQGHISYSEQIGELDLGEELKLPLFILFNSGWEASSPYLGKGWNFCLLDSRMEQIDENTFKLVQPDGWYRIFGRSKSDDTVLRGQGDWKAEIKGDIIMAYAPCGWKIEFHQGKIASVTTPKGRQLVWVYENGHVSELREGNYTFLKLEYGVDAKTVQALALSDGRRILLTQGNKPRVQTISGQNVITGVDRSLATVRLADGRERSYSFGTDEHLQPTLRVENTVGTTIEHMAPDPSNSRVLAWNPQTLLAIRDGMWTYHITSAKKAGDNAAIARSNVHNQKEYWFWDGEKGEETVETLSGNTYVRSEFTSGMLAGRDRKIEKILQTSVQTVYRATYSDDGSLLRVFEQIPSDLPTEMRPKYVPFSKEHDSTSTTNLGGETVVTRYFKGLPVSSTRGISASNYVAHGEKLIVEQHDTTSRKFQYLVQNGQLIVAPEMPAQNTPIHK